VDYRDEGLILQNSIEPNFWDILITNLR
jgi:hypothetical protein